MSWRPDQFAFATYTLQIRIALEGFGYAFPPFALIGQCLQKIKMERCTVLLIAPCWRSQPWFPALLELLVDFPILLLQHEDLQRDPYNQPHPQRSLQLASWKVSGDNMLQLVFRNKLQNFWSQDGARVPHCISVRLAALV